MPAAARGDGQGRAVARDRDAAVGVGPEDPGAGRPQALERARVGVPVAVAGPGAHDRHPGLDLFEERAGAGRATAMVRDLEDVDRLAARSVGCAREPAGRVHQPVGKELGIDLLLDVAGQQQPMHSEAHVEDDRDVVDAGTGIGRLLRHLAAARPAHGESRAIEREMVAGHERLARAPEPGECLLVRRVARARATHARLRQGAHRVALEEEGESRYVVLVGMGEHDEVEPAVPGRESRVEERQQPIGVGPRIDEDAAAPVALEQDGVSLADVEDGHAKAPVRACDDDEGEKSGDEAEAGRDRNKRPPPPSRARRLRTGVAAPCDRSRPRALPRPPGEESTHERPPAAGPGRDQEERRQRRPGRVPG
jgi:hypothetical protein